MVFCLKELVLALCVCQLLLAKIPSQFEGRFSKASLLYRDGRYDEALELIEKISAVDPNIPEVSELRALTLKTKGDNAAARAEYQKLYQRAKEENDQDKKAVYGFELGALAVKAGKHKQAKSYLKDSIRAGFNPSAAHFLLGSSAFEKELWDESLYHFGAVNEGENAGLKPMATLFLAQASAKTNRVSDAAGYFVEARALASESVNSNALEDTKELARRVLETADKELRSWDKNQFFADVGLSTGYDSNVLSIPNTGTENSGISGPGSLKETLTWGLGYASSPVSAWQFLGAYRGTVNYNLSEDTRSGMFFTHDATVFLTHGAMSRRLYGLRVGGNGVLQYQTDTFKPYSLTGTFGPFVKWRVSDDWWLGAEAFFQPSKNYLDPTVSESLQKSGWEQWAKVYAVSSEMDKWWSPGAYLSAGVLNPNGQEYQGRKVQLDLVNTMYLTQSWIVSESLGLGGSWYPERPGDDRTDQNVSLGVSGGYRASPALTITGATQYSRNFSSVNTYRYDRWVFSASGNYRF